MHSHDSTQGCATLERGLAESLSIHLAIVTTMWDHAGCIMIWMICFRRWLGGRRHGADGHDVYWFGIVTQIIKQTSAEIQKN